MKKIITVLMLCLFASACAQSRTVNGHHATSFGFFNPGKQRADVCYDLSVGNLIWGLILVETVIAPIYFFGFSLWEPIGPKTEKAVCDK